MFDLLAQLGENRIETFRIAEKFRKRQSKPLWAYPVADQFPHCGHIKRSNRAKEEFQRCIVHGCHSKKG